MILGYIFAGIAIGSIYAIASAGISLTYASTGVLNFGFGALAYFVARSFYFFNTQHHYTLLVSAILSLLVVAPLLGVTLWLILFRFLARRSPLIKTVATIGLSVALLPLTDICFGLQNITSAPGLAPQPVAIYQFLDASVDANQIAAFLSVVLVLVLGAGLLRFTSMGLRVRMTVDSPALASLSGVRPSMVAAAMWAISAFLAGLAGILVAPTSGLTQTSMLTLMAVAFAPVVLARLHKVEVAVIAAFAMAFVTELAQLVLSPSGGLSTTLVPSIPFAFVVVYLVWQAIRGRGSEGDGRSGGSLDSAVGLAVGEESQILQRRSFASDDRDGLKQVAVLFGPMLILAVVVLLAPYFLSAFILGLVVDGIAFAIVLLSYTLLTGEGGMLWLCQITIAGLGASITAQLVTNHGWSVIPAALLSAVLLVPVGLLLGALTVRLGDLYVALVTLGFGLLCDQLVFQLNAIYQAGQGVFLSRPSFAASNQNFLYLCAGVFIALALVVIHLRRTTGGMSVLAIRSSPPAAMTAGVSVVRTKLLVVALATFTAAFGGSFIAMYQGAAVPGSFDTFTGLLLLAVVITIGARSVTAALVAGLCITVVPGLWSIYIPLQYDAIPTVLFGVGAVMVAKNPRGVVTQYATALRGLAERFRRDALGAPEQQLGELAEEAPRMPAQLPGGGGRSE
jgi:branched-chain amino acid transport system permease protein